MVGKLFPLAPNVALGTWNNNQGAKVSPICFFSSGRRDVDMPLLSLILTYFIIVVWGGGGVKRGIEK